MKKEILMPAIALFVICLVSSVLLAATNAVTKDKIAQSAIANAEASRKVAFENAESFSDEKTVTLESGKDVLVSDALDASGNVIGYVFTSVNRGYGGDVKVMTGIDASGTVLRSVILSMSDETPGLGQNASKPEFIEQFSNKTGPFSWVKSNGSGNEITGVTSASFTSKAVIACVNDSLDAFASLGGGAQ